MRHATSGPLSLLSPGFSSSRSLSGVMPPAADHLNNGGKLEEPTQRDAEEGIEEERGEINENGGGAATKMPVRSPGGRRPFYN